MQVLIIGAGLAGTTTACLLALRGCAVTVIDARDGAGLETSFANGGMLTPSQSDPWNAPGFQWQLLRWLGREDAPMLLRPRALPSLLRWALGFVRNSRPARYRANMLHNAVLANYNLQVLRDLRATHALVYDAAMLGTLKVFRQQRALDRAAALATLIAGTGCRHRVVDAATAVSIEPALRPIAGELTGAIHYPDDESGDAFLFTQAMAGIAARHGVRFRFGVRATALDLQGRRVLGALAGAERLPADVTVLAAGAWSGKLLETLQLRLPVQPVKGYSITVPIGNWRQPPSVPVVDDALHAAVTPLGQRLRVAGTAEFAGFDRQVREPRIANLFKLLLRLYPDYAAYLDRAQAGRWAGLRPMSCDGVPIVGTCSYQNLYFNTGHGHLGWSMCVGSARLLTDLMLGATPAIDPAPYSIMRFNARRPVGAGV